MAAAWAQRFPALGRVQATTLALRLGRGLGLGGGSEQRAWRPPPAVAVVAARRRAGLPAVTVARYDALAADAQSAPERGVLERALAGGAAIESVEALARAWAELSPSERRQVADPLRPAGGGGTGPVLIAGAPARQWDQTTCGSTVLALLAAAGDPVLALWLVTGQLMPPGLPREMRALTPADRADPDPAARFAALQRALKDLSNAGGLGPLPWPARFGTPPWGAARVARHPGVAFRAVMIDDTDAPGFAALLDRADRALSAGVGVPLFTGGDLASGPATAVPRHVVLLVPRRDRAAAGPDQAAEPAQYTVFEPARGQVHRVARADLLAPAGPRAALGGWAHVCWAVLPGA
ncbi:hypothetical protein [Pengzhenrongella sicca]|uniref:Uncharacterized protein n=1 Tax=Pengzhenrongella sicca TaxID=2819238 RepID=A0A8A4ZD29_9MICO|nr:hypothetical protein [Pengzhenrongella sicca]QTE28793.1 hypothetical protein J4E96_15850 [Pengzhenrongella sicca]